VDVSLALPPIRQSLVRATAVAVLVLNQSVAQVAAPGSRTPPCHLRVRMEAGRNGSARLGSDEDRTQNR
jgi:hypothetical protein